MVLTKACLGNPFLCMWKSDPCRGEWVGMGADGKQGKVPLRAGGCVQGSRRQHGLLALDCVAWLTEVFPCP